MARSNKNEGDARTRLVEAAGRGFRTGIWRNGVDALAKGAGLTSARSTPISIPRPRRSGLSSRMGWRRCETGSRRFRSAMAAAGGPSSISISASEWSLESTRPAVYRVFHPTWPARTMRPAPSMRKS